MSSGSIFSIVLLIVTIVGFIVARKRIKRETPQKLDALSQQLRAIGVKASRVSEDVLMDQYSGRIRKSMDNPGLLRVQGRQFDYLRLTGTAQQYNVTYFLDFLVNRNPISSGQKVSSTILKLKNRPAINSGVTGFHWKGDTVLAQRLNDDHHLNDILLNVDRKYLKGGITVYPEREKSYTRIRITSELLELELLKALDIIAGHIKRTY